MVRRGPGRAEPMALCALSERCRLCDSVWLVTTPAFNPIQVHSRADIAAFLAERRRSLGMTCEELDYHAGFSDRYVTKMENGGKPGMRQGFRISHMAEVWLEALGCALVVVPLDMLAQIGATRCPVTA